jgi:hypothetical protein
MVYSVYWSNFATHHTVILPSDKAIGALNVYRLRACFSQDVKARAKWKAKANCEYNEWFLINPHVINSATLSNGIGCKKYLV